MKYQDRTMVERFNSDIFTHGEWDYETMVMLIVLAEAEHLKSVNQFKRVPHTIY